jgi:hypothetical protein
LRGKIPVLLVTQHKFLVLLTLLLGLLMFFFATSTAPAQEDSVCPPPGQTLKGVYSPSRLKVLNPCQSFSGTVTKTTPEADGDVHVQVRPDPQYRDLLAPKQEVPGNLVTEIMPRDRGHLPVPSPGDHVDMTGAWVHDKNHNWNELHPIFSESINGGPVYTSGPQYSK